MLTLSALANKKQLVQDLLIKAKQMEALIDALPAAKEFDNPSPKADGEAPNADDADEELASLEKEMQEVNAEYLSVLEEAGELISSSWP